MSITSPTLSGMETGWPVDSWRPSILPGGSWQRPDPEAIPDAITLLITCTSKLHERPYHPRYWLVRAKALLFLGYPELSIGDAYKAVDLCDATKNDDQCLIDKVQSSKGLRFSGFRLKSRIALSLGPIRQEACFVLVTALEYCNSYHEAYFVCTNAATLYPLDRRFSETSHRLARSWMDQDADTGGFIATQYPWMASDHQRRLTPVLASSIAHMEGISSGSLTISESTIAPHDKRHSKHVRWLDHDRTKPFTITGRAITRHFVPSKDFDKQYKMSRNVNVPDSDVWGVFATRNIPKNTLLLTDVTVSGVASIKTKNTCGNCFGPLVHARHSGPCCNTSFCTTLCRDLALASYHKAICGKSLAWVESEAARQRSEAPHALLLLRFLASSVQEDAHPLSHELASPLTGQYDGTHIVSFTLRENIVQPLRMLRDLGVDIFADRRYETWAVLTLQHRISINRRVEPYRLGGFMVAVNPCFSVFNHSCEANASWSENGSSTVEIRSTRDIKNGEEVFVNYRGSAESSTWFEGGQCQCPRCKCKSEDKGRG